MMPKLRPARPFFLQALVPLALAGPRSLRRRAGTFHRAKSGKAALNDVITRSKAILNMP